jgi:putative acetyltransferase
MVSIIEYEDKYASRFKELNLEWLDKYGLTEEGDLAMLNDPRGKIIDTGGALFLAADGDEIVGSAALIQEGAGEYELAKMAVAETWQGKGISKLLIQKCLSTAKELGAKRIYLVSNSQLTTAISLYEKYGFTHTPVIDAHYLTADVMMELIL